MGEHGGAIGYVWFSGESELTSARSTAHLGPVHLCLAEPPRAPKAPPTLAVSTTHLHNAFREKRDLTVMAGVCVVF